MYFNDLGLRAALLRAVHERGYNVPTPVQAQAIPIILSGRDLVVAAKSGAGKTAAFALPMLQRLMGIRREPSWAIRGLIMVATRKHASQVAGSVRQYGAHLPIRCTAIFGCEDTQRKADVSRLGVDIIVATPGCLGEYACTGSVDLRNVEVLILDEADHMLERGFIHDIRKLLPLMSNRRQSVMFSATFPDEVETLACRLFGKPDRVELRHFNDIPKCRSGSSVARIGNSKSDSFPSARIPASSSRC